MAGTERNLARSVAAAPPRSIDELQQLQDQKQRELAAVQAELETARWVADYDAASLHGQERIRAVG